MPTAISAKLIGCEQIVDNEQTYILASFADGTGLALSGNGDVLFESLDWDQMLKRLLVLDWLQENVVGKTATLNCSAVDDVWVKAQVESGS